MIGTVTIIVRSLLACRDSFGAMLTSLDCKESALVGVREKVAGVCDFETRDMHATATFVSSTNEKTSKSFLPNYEIYETVEVHSTFIWDPLFRWYY